MNNAVVDHVDPVNYQFEEDGPSVSVPVKYGQVYPDDFGLNSNSLAAYSMDLLEAVVYKKTGVQIRPIFAEARKDPSKIKELAGVVDNALGQGSYQKLRTTKYENKGDNNAILTTLFLQSKV